MAKFRKKPVVIEAVQLTQDMIDAAVLDQAPLPTGCRIGHASAHPPARVVHYATVVIDTLEVVMRADPGDWIITGVKGEIYPCKPDIFAATYEPAE